MMIIGFDIRENHPQGLDRFPRGHVTGGWFCIHGRFGRLSHLIAIGTQY